MHIQWLRANALPNTLNAQSAPVIFQETWRSEKKNSKMNEILNSYMRNTLVPKLEEIGFHVLNSVEDGPFGSAFWDLTNNKETIRTVWDARDQQIRFEWSDGTKNNYGEVFKGIMPVDFKAEDFRELPISKQLILFERALFELLKRKETSN